MKYRRVRWNWEVLADETADVSEWLRPSTLVEISTPGGRTLGRFHPSGLLTLFVGYAWDGASGPAVDTATNARASACHDFLYQALRLGLLPQSDRKAADTVLRELMIADGANRARAWYFYHAVRLVAGKAARPRTG